MQSPRCVNGGPPQLFIDGVAMSAEVTSTAPRTGTRALGGGRTAPAFGRRTHQHPLFAACGWSRDNSAPPVGFKLSGLRCGALLLWSRERQASPNHEAQQHVRHGRHAHSILARLGTKLEI